MNKIIVEFIGHKDQRYDTVGDWYYGKDDPQLLHIRISRMSNQQREFMVLLHELTELALCAKAGITVEQVDEYDLSHPDAGGDECDMADAPYLDQHSKAMTVERMLCHFFGENWVDYEKELDAL